MKRFLRVLLLLLLLGLAALAGFFFIETGQEERSPFEFVPEDFVYMIESDRPTGDWQSLSETEVWQTLKGNPFFADITESADYLDSLLQSNQTLVDLISLGDLVVSAHLTPRGPEENDFLILVDLRGIGRKLPKLKFGTVELFKSLGYEVETDQYFNIDLYDLYDAEAEEHMFLATIDNVLIFSYNQELVKRAVIQSEQPSIREDVAFAAVQEEADRGALYNVYLNFRRLPALMALYTDELPSTLVGIDSIMSFAALDLDMGDEFVELAGYARQVDSVPSYLSVFSDVGRGEIHAGDILPTSTVMYSSIGFDDFDDFYQRFDARYAQSDPEGHADLLKNQQRLERFLKIEVKRDFFSWMTDELVTAIVPVKGQFAYVAMMHFDDYEQTKERLDYVGARIGKTVVRFDEQDYRGFPIKYLEMKGFFKLFFRKMFDKIEQPHYTYLDDYVVFSNDTTSLQYLIDEYLQSKTLARDPSYEDFLNQFESTSNLYTYIRTENFYPYLRSILDREARNDIGNNRESLLRFPQMGFQLYPAKGMYRMYFYSEFSQAGSLP
jgi:hypothetical protein